MPRFIPADDGTWINVSHVAVVRKSHYVGKKPFLVFETPDGRSIGRVTNLDHDVETLLAGRPDSVRSQRVPITGWRITYGTPEPVLLEEACDNTRTLIELPDGRYLEQEGATYADVADAEAHILADDQADWDRQHAKVDGGKP